MRRREFLGVLGGAAAAWPLTTRAQQGERVRRVGVLGGLESLETQGRMAAFRHGLAQLGWNDGRNARIDARWSGGDAALARRYAAELVTLAPDVILAIGGAHLGPLLQTSRTVPIVFVIVPDPVGSGFVRSLARPRGNATGFMQFEYGLSAKWLELLKEIAPSVTRVVVLWDPAVTAGIGQFAVIQSVAPSLGVELNPVDIRDAGEVERDVADFARSGHGGMIVPASSLSVTHRGLLITLAARHRLPAIYVDRVNVAAGGLMSYGADFADQYRRAAGYVDRILKGEKPADLPVQAPTKYNLTINLKTAKTLGLAVPGTLLARADEVIE
jgi:putative ABC transport system substrate-binding protein